MRSLEKKGYITTLETGSRVVKSDTLVDENLRSELMQAVQPLLEKEEKDFHPGSNEQVLNLVHPSLFPFVYGRTRFVQGAQVGVQTAFEATESTHVAPADQKLVERSQHGQGLQSSKDNAGRWSNRFQWLPSDIKFRGEEGTDVEIASYINNLHPVQHKPLYGVIEKLISLAIEPWNDVLIKSGDGRTPERILTYGATFNPSETPSWDADLPLNRDACTEQEWDAAVKRVKKYMALPDDADPADDDDDDDEMLDEFPDGDWEENYVLSNYVEWKFKRLRKVEHPEPGVSYSYEDWKAGRLLAPVVGGTSWGGSGSKSHQYYDVKLQEDFRDKGLQVIVKLASIELTPSKPDYGGGNWHIEGMLNEHIVATAIYYYDVENTSESRISFRQEASLDNMDMSYEQDDHQPLAEIFGTDSLRDEPAIQDLGTITTPQGRLLVFPNTLQHKVASFGLKDRTKPGHRRFIVLWLVDPNYHIMSTAHVPPQQYQWRAEENERLLRVGERLPPELADMVQEGVKEGLMKLDDAKQLRLELMAERTKLMPTVERNFDSYNFCEH